MNLYVFLGGVALAIAIFFGGMRVGGSLSNLEHAQARAVEVDRILVKDRVLIQKVPEIVTRVVHTETTIEKEVDRVVAESQHLLAPDCVLPGDFGLLLVAAANGRDPAAENLDDLTGDYGCRETLAAILSDLRAGWRNTARLEGLQEFQSLVTTPSTTKGDSP